MKRFNKFIAITMSLMICLTTVLYGNTLDDLEDEKDNLQDTIEGGKQEIEDMKSIIDEISKNIIQLDSDIKDKNNLVEDYEIKSVEKEKEIDVAKIELDHAIKDEIFYKEQVDARIKVMYEYGEASYAEVLLEAKDIGDFFNRLEYLSRIFEYDEVMLEKLQFIHDDIKAKEAQLEIEQATLEHLIAETNLQKKELENLYIAKSIEMNRIEEDKELMAVQIEEWEKEDEELDKLIRKKILEGKFSFKDGDKFSWPTKGYFTITSPFGQRTHPVTGAKLSFHSGIDIAAPYGATVSASASGQVVMSRYSGTYGNLVVLNHGGGYYTYYAHNSRLLVSEGEDVVRGQQISLIGSTGRSTGPHLHFSVKKNGEWMNPISYFER